MNEEMGTPERAETASDMFVIPMSIVVFYLVLLWWLLLFSKSKMIAIGEEIVPISEDSFAEEILYRVYQRKVVPLEEGGGKSTKGIGFLKYPRGLNRKSKRRIFQTAL